MHAESPYQQNTFAFIYYVLVILSFMLQLFSQVIMGLRPRQTIQILRYIMYKQAVYYNIAHVTPFTSLGLCD